MPVIDAKGAVVGRLAAHVAKLALSGQQVTILNIESAVITGNAVKIEEKYSGRRGIQHKGDPAHSVKWPRRPDFLFKKILSGMLPKGTVRRKWALAKVKAYIGAPKGFAAPEKASGETGHKKITVPHVTLSQLCKQLGWSHAA